MYTPTLGFTTLDNSIRPPNTAKVKKANPQKLKGVVTFFSNSEFFKSLERVDGYLGSYNHSTGTKNTPHLLYVDI